MSAQNYIHNSLIPINQAFIDSLKLRIPYDSCEIIDQELISSTSIYYHDTGNLDCEILPPAPYKICIDGITFRIQITNIPIYNPDTQQRESTKFIEIVLTSKLLRERYFEGITKENLHHFYEIFMSYDVFHCEYEEFLNAQVSDIDIAINRYCQSTEAWIEIIRSIYNQTGTKQKYLRKIIESSNIGLQFNTRHSAKPSLPNLKLYHKELEMHSKSAEFYNTYLFPKFDGPLKGLTRIEATIKNALHKRRLYKYSILPEFKTLKELSEIEEVQLRKFVFFSVSAYVTKTLRKKAPNLSPTDHLLF